jgi:hypothetical protein
MDINTRKAASGLRLTAFSLGRVFMGIFLLWGQYEFQEPGTIYGFLLPQNLHEWLIDCRTVSLFIVAAWLIRTGLWGDKHRKKNA